MIYILINAIPILIATAASLAFGYTVTRVSATHRIGPRVAITAFVAEFWLCSILAGALILAPPEAGEWVMAIGSAVVIWIGFVAPALVVTDVYRGRPVKSIALACGHWLAAMLIQAVVLQAIGLTPPPGAPGAPG